MNARADYIEQCLLQFLERAREEFRGLGHKGMTESTDRAINEVRELAEIIRKQNNQEENENV